MSEGVEATLVCGFGDLGSGLGALAWSIAGGGGVLLSDGSTSATEARISPEGDGVRVELTAGQTAVEATVSPRPSTPALEGGSDRNATDSIRAAACDASVHSAGSDRALPCPGHLTSWAADPLEGVGTFRHLAIETGTGSLLLVCASGAPGGEHGDELVSAWTIDAEAGVSEFDEALISTQYDGAERPTRIGLELWPGADAPPTRVAGSVLGGADAGGSWAGLLRCHTDGVEGLGSYLLRRG